MDRCAHAFNSVQHLDTATEVILSGGSAGGLAVYYHLDYIAAAVKSMAPAARVTGFPDAGYFADLQNTQGCVTFQLHSTQYPHFLYCIQPRMRHKHVLRLLV